MWLLKRTGTCCYRENAGEGDLPKGGLERVANLGNRRPTGQFSKLKWSYSGRYTNNAGEPLSSFSSVYLNVFIDCVMTRTAERKPEEPLGTFPRVLGQKAEFGFNFQRNAPYLLILIKR